MDKLVVLERTPAVCPHENCQQFALESNLHLSEKPEKTGKLQDNTRSSGFPVEFPSSSS